MSRLLYTAPLLINLKLKTNENLIYTQARALKVAFGIPINTSNTSQSPESSIWNSNKYFKHEQNGREWTNVNKPNNYN